MSGSRPYFLKTERLGFGRWSQDDLPLALALWGDPEVTRYIGGPFSERRVRERLAREIASMNEAGVQYWPLFLRSSDEFVGCTGLHPRKSELRCYQLGFHFRPAFWKQGLAEEAGRAAVAYAFESLGAEELFAGHHPENAASRRVLEKLGFHFTHEEFYSPTGLLHSSYSLRRP